MATFKDLMPNRRRTTVVGTLIFLLALFFVPYVFIYIPSNEANLKRQGFLKLNRAALNIIEKSNDTRKYYKHIYKNNKAGLDSISSDEMADAECIDNMEQLTFNDSISFKFFNSDGWHIFFNHRTLPKTKNKPSPTWFLGSHQPLEGFVKPCLVSGKEVFNSFLLVHHCQAKGKNPVGKIIYQDIHRGMEQDIIMDSLLPRKQGILSPDISDVKLQGDNYKMFSYPFQLGHHNLVLCGFLKSDSYESKINIIPVDTVYALLIGLTLFLLSLPLLKIFMMNERDRIYASNLVVGARFVFVMATFITIIFVQLLLLWQGKIQVRQNLEDLSGKIEDSLSVELKQVQEQLIYFDDFLSGYLDSTAEKMTAGKLPEDKIYLKIINDSGFDNGRFIGKNRILKVRMPKYHFFDQGGWARESGEGAVRVKYPRSNAQNTVISDSERTHLTLDLVNITERPYYQYFLRHRFSKEDRESTLMIAPVQSWTTNEFAVNVCRFSKMYKTKDSLMLENLSTRLYSLVNTILPAGYGYCLMDDSGSVLIHSDTSKSLKENFLEETGQEPWILRVLSGRQPNQSDNSPFYGSIYSLRIQPLKQHPLFLAVFYNNSYLVPANLRVLTFSVFFSLFTYGLLFLIYQIFHSKLPETCLFSPMDYYGRLFPNSKKMSLYINGSLFLVVYIGLLMVAAIMSPDVGKDFDFSVFVFTLLTPFNILYALRLLEKAKETSGLMNDVVKLVLPLLTAFAIYRLSVITEHPLAFSFIVLELIFAALLLLISLKNGNLWIWITNLVSPRLRKIVHWSKRSQEQKKLFAYSCFVTLFIFAVAVFPALEFNWFAYVHELHQSVKKEQLLLAKDLQKRERSIRAYLRANQPDFTGRDNNFDTIQYMKGIYPLFNDKILYQHLPDSLPTQVKNDSMRRKNDTGEHQASSEPFYQDVANTINFFSIDPSGLPTLYDSTMQDNLWHWDLKDGISKFDFSKAAWTIPPAVNDSTNPPLYFSIQARLVKGLRLHRSLVILFAGMLILLVCLIYWTTRSIAHQAFLTKIVSDAGPEIKMLGSDEYDFWKASFDEWVKEQTDRKSKYSSVNVIIDRMKQEYTDFDKPDKDLASTEFNIVGNSQEFESFFECVWKNLNEKEKYLLYCLANDGLLNHKNESLIYAMLYKRLLLIYDQRVRLISYSFRNFIISRNNTKEEKILLGRMQSEASWGYMRTILLVIIISVFVFLFLTQQEVSGKIIAIATSISALLPLLLRFGRSSPDAAAKK
jgi:hypothetical protein